jgi:hydrogenase maturation protease
MTVRLCVLAWGNASRGDDALGPTFLARAAADPDPPVVTTTFVEDFQLQPEHAIDLRGSDLALFVDASRDALDACTFREVAAAPCATFTTHGLGPAAVLAAYAATYGAPPPPAFELGIRAARFDLGSPMSAQAGRDLEAALALFARLRSRPDVDAWRAIARRARAADTFGTRHTRAGGQR